MPWPRRIPHGWLAVHVANCRRPYKANRRESTNSSVSSPKPPLPATHVGVPRQTSAPSPSVTPGGDACHLPSNCNSSLHTNASPDRPCEEDLANMLVTLSCRIPNRTPCRSRPFLACRCFFHRIEGKLLQL